MRPEPEIWIDEGPSHTAKRSVPKRKETRKAVRKGSASLDKQHLVALVGAQRADRLIGRISTAADAYAGERYDEARQILLPIVREVPDYIESRELFGLALYRLGRWNQAVTQLEAFIKLSGYSTEQHPVLADCYRALGKYADVDRLWRELREASPSPDLVNEGRIVAAGALADQGRLNDAIKLLSGGFRMPKQPKEYHLRRAYALADLYERSGDVLQARNLFGRIAHCDDGWLDAEERFRMLG